MGGSNNWMAINKQIVIIKELLAEERKKSGSPPYLEDIDDALKVLVKTYIQNPTDANTLSRYAGGLGRIVLEDYDFARSKLGSEIITLLNYFIGPRK
jgi:hypothetical protein